MQRRVSTLAVVEQFHVIKYSRPRLFVTEELPVMCQFIFQAAEEAFNDRIVVAVAAPAHACFRYDPALQRVVLGTGVG